MAMRRQGISLLLETVIDSQDMAHDRRHRTFDLKPSHGNLIVHLRRSPKEIPLVLILLGALLIPSDAHSQLSNQERSLLKSARSGVFCIEGRGCMLDIELTIDSGDMPEDASFSERAMKDACIRAGAELLDELQALAPDEPIERVRVSLRKQTSSFLIFRSYSNKVSSFPVIDGKCQAGAK